MENNALQKLSYGLYVLTARSNKRDNGCIINTAIQAASQPNMLCISVSKENYTHSMLRDTGIFNISVINQAADFGLFERFGFSSGSDTDKLKDYKSVARSENGIYYLTDMANAFLSVKVSAESDLGSHSLFVGEITEMQAINSIPSVTYELYHNKIKPSAKKEHRTDKAVWRCKICGYEYEGETLPEGYICPICKHPAADFERL